jgi:hypothetical protein
MLVDLPTEILVLIFILLDDVSLYNLTISNKYLSQITTDDIIWKNKYRTDFETFKLYTPETKIKYALNFPNKLNIKCNREYPITITSSNHIICKTSIWLNDKEYSIDVKSYKNNIVTDLEIQEPIVGEFVDSNNSNNIKHVLKYEESGMVYYNHEIVCAYTGDLLALSRAPDKYNIGTNIYNTNFSLIAHIDNFCRAKSRYSIPIYNKIDTDASRYTLGKFGNYIIYLCDKKCINVLASWHEIIYSEMYDRKKRYMFEYPYLILITKNIPVKKIDINFQITTKNIVTDEIKNFHVILNPKAIEKYHNFKTKFYYKIIKHRLCFVVKLKKNNHDNYRHKIIINDLYFFNFITNKLANIQLNGKVYSLDINKNMLVTNGNKGVILYKY